MGLRLGTRKEPKLRAHQSVTFAWPWERRCSVAAVSSRGRTATLPGGPQHEADCVCCVLCRECKSEWRVCGVSPGSPLVSYLAVLISSSVARGRSRSGKVGPARQTAGCAPGRPGRSPATSAALGACSLPFLDHVLDGRGGAAGGAANAPRLPQTTRAATLDVSECP